MNRICTALNVQAIIVVLSVISLNGIAAGIIVPKETVRIDRSFYPLSGIKPISDAYIQANHTKVTYHIHINLIHGVILDSSVLVINDSVYPLSANDFEVVERYPEDREKDAWYLYFRGTFDVIRDMNYAYLLVRDNAHNEYENLSYV
ncbi:hypothetical protein JXA85_00800, partial [Candidatus Woesearchaeota archaeon]|nr:hypothetical protein [Candidatus Woesearchaeota archaeon]